MCAFSIGAQVKEDFMKRIISMILTVALLACAICMLSACNGVTITNGADGAVPRIGKNGNWWIDGVDTGVSAKGENGDKGDTGAAGADSQVNGEDGKDASASTPKFRINAILNKIEVTYDNGETWKVAGKIPGTAGSISYPVDKAIMLEGYLNHEGKYVTADSRHGAIIDLSVLKENGYTTVTLERNSSGTPLQYAFIASDLVLNSKPTYTSGFTGVKSYVDQTLVLEIPSNAKYLYVTYNQLTVVSMPAAITFSK